MAAADDDRNYRREDDRGSEDPDRKGWPRLEFHNRETIGECGRGRVGCSNCETRDASGSVAKRSREWGFLRSEDQLRTEPGRIAPSSRAQSRDPVARREQFHRVLRLRFAPLRMTSQQRQGFSFAMLDLIHRALLR